MIDRTRLVRPIHYSLTLVVVLLIIPVCIPGQANKERRVSFNEAWLFKHADPPGDVALVTRAAVANKARDAITLRDDTFGSELSYSHIDFDDDDWRRLDLPHDWCIEGNFDPSIHGESAMLPCAGVGWYRKHFQVSANDSDKQIYLEIDGAMSHSAVWVNGKYAGGWPYGYTSYRIDLTRYLQFGGENVVAIRLDNPPESSRWYTGAGIYRNVWLTKVARVHIDVDGPIVTTPVVSRDSARIHIKNVVKNDTAREMSVLVRTSIYRRAGRAKDEASITRLPDREVLIKADSSVTLESETALPSPLLWSPNQPNLYVAVTEVIADGVILDPVETTFGIRSIRFDPNIGLLINDEPVEIKGVCLHHDFGAIGAAFNIHALKRQLDIMQEMGANAIRTSHNPPAPELLELADERGLLIVEEAFDIWSTAKRPNDYSTLFNDWHEADLRAMVRRDRNHPSVIMWSIGNEVPEQVQDGHVIANRLAKIVREEDPTRPVTAAANLVDSGFNGFQNVVDVFGYNYHPERYRVFRRSNSEIPLYSSESSSTLSSRGEYFFPVPRARSDIEADRRPTSDEIISDWYECFFSSHKCLASRRPGRFDPHLEDIGAGYVDLQVSSYDLYHQDWATTAEAEFQAQDEYPFVAGEFVWSGFDYLGETNPFSILPGATASRFTDAALLKWMADRRNELRRFVLPQRSSYWGIVDLAGFKKDRFYLYQARWRPELPMAHILPHWNWPERVGQVTPVHVYTSGDEAELFLNGRSLGRKSKRRFEYRLRWDDVVYEPGELLVIAYKDGLKWAEDRMVTTGTASAIRLSPDRRQMVSDGVELVFVTAEIVDEADRMVPRSRDRISFEISGPGEIVATDNGNAIDLDAFHSHERNAFNGLALAIVRAKKGEAGEVVLRATSTGLKTSEIRLIVKTPASLGQP